MSTPDPDNHINRASYVKKLKLQKIENVIQDEDTDDTVCDEDIQQNRSWDKAFVIATIL